MIEGVVVVIGDGAVGKSNILSRLMFREFSTHCDPTIEDIFIMHSEHNGEAAVVRYIDTSGQDDFFALMDISLKECHVVMIVYDVDRPQTLSSAHMHLHHVIKIRKESGLPHLILVGNKTDKEPSMLCKATAESLAHETSSVLKWTSAMNNEGIDELRQNILEHIPHVEDDHKCSCTLL